MEASSRKPHQINWCEFVNRADGISELEGKGRRGDRANRAGSEFQIRLPRRSTRRRVSQKRLRKILNSDEHFDRSFSFIAMKGNYRIRKRHERDISREDGARLSFPVETSEPELESRAMKKKQTETKSRSGFGLTRHLIGGVLCLAVISLICSSASAQNLFAVDLRQRQHR